jgi:hypothetical protein
VRHEDLSSDDFTFVAAIVPLHARVLEQVGITEHTSWSQLTDSMLALRAAWLLVGIVLIAVLVYARYIRSFILSDRRFFGINLHKGRSYWYACCSLRADPNNPAIVSGCARTPSVYVRSSIHLSSHGGQAERWCVGCRDTNEPHAG